MFHPQTIPIKSNVTTSPVDTPSKTITYFTLASSLAPGNLVIAAGGANFTFALPAKQNTKYVPSRVAKIDPLTIVLASTTPTLALSPTSSTVSISPRMPHTSSTSVSQSLAGVAMPSLHTTRSATSRTRATTGTSRTVLPTTVKRTIGSVGFLMQAQTLSSPFLRMFLHPLAVTTEPDCDDDRLDWVAKDTTSYSYSAAIYPSTLCHAVFCPSG